MITSFRRSRPTIGPVLAPAAVCLVLAGCGTVSRADAPADPPTASPAADPRVPDRIPGAPESEPPPSPSPSTSPSASRRGAAKPRPLGKRGAWRVTTYYTAVEKYHGGKRTAVRGCTHLHCRGAKDPLGSYPAEFLKIIRMEGSGKITSGRHAGRYLNWATGLGWWLDDSTRDSRGKPLRPWSTAAVNRDIMKRGQKFTVAGCGKTSGGAAVDAKVCARFRSATWTVRDVFRPGWGGEHRADLYIGEETGPGFTESGFYTTLTGATLHAAP